MSTLPLNILAGQFNKPIYEGSPMTDVVKASQMAETQQAKRDELTRAAQARDAFSRALINGADLEEAARAVAMYDPNLALQLHKEHRAMVAEAPTTKKEVQRLEQLVKDYTRSIDGMRRNGVKETDAIMIEENAKRDRAYDQLSQYDPVMYPPKKPTAVAGEGGGSETPTPTSTAPEAVLRAEDELVEYARSLDKPESYTKNGVLKSPGNIRDEIQKRADRVYPGNSTAAKALVDRAMNIINSNADAHKAEVDRGRADSDRRIKLTEEQEKRVKTAVDVIFNDSIAKELMAGRSALRILDVDREKLKDPAARVGLARNFSEVIGGRRNTSAVEGLDAQNYGVIMNTIRSKIGAVDKQISPESALGYANSLVKLYNDNIRTLDEMIKESLGSASPDIQEGLRSAIAVRRKQFTPIREFDLSETTTTPPQDGPTSRVTRAQELLNKKKAGGN